MNEAFVGSFQYVILILLTVQESMTFSRPSPDICVNVSVLLLVFVVLPRASVNPAFALIFKVQLLTG